jgi:SOS-response transcriptional repressor LexA
MKALTPKQKLIINFIQEYTKEKGQSPTYREIQEFLGISIAGAKHHVDLLKHKGVLKNKYYTHRSFQCVPVLYTIQDI